MNSNITPRAPMGQGNRQRTAFIPPWIWAWLVLYLIDFRTLFANMVTNILIIFSNQPDSDLVSRSVSLAELIPPLAIFIGVLFVLLPWLRALRLSIRYNIQTVEQVRDDTEFAAETGRDLAAIADFLSLHAPTIRLMYAVGRPHRNPQARPAASTPGSWFNACKDYLTDRFARPLPDRAITYPVGYRTMAIAVSGRFLALWRRERAQAEEILLHELAHYRHGDSYILGAGSFLEIVSKNWLFITLIFTLIPVLTAMVIQDIASFQGYQSLMPILPNLPGRIIAHDVATDLPLLFQVLLFSLFLSASNFVVLLAAIWSAELNADRFVVDTTHSMDFIDSQPGQKKQSPIQRVADAMTHPPMALRRWAATPGRGGRNLFLLLLFPFIFLLLLLLKIGSAISYSLQNPFVFSWESVLPLLGSIVWIEFGAALLILLWPLFSRYWERGFSRVDGERNSASYRVYVISAACLLGLCIVSVAPSLFPASLPADTVNSASDTGPLLTALAVSNVTPLPTQATDSLPIPVLAPNYSGTLTTSGTSSPATITFSNLQQDQQGNIKGTLTIATMGKGTFTGTIDSNRSINFTFTPSNSNATLQFSGAVKADNTLGGIYMGNGQTGTWQAQQTK